MLLLTSQVSQRQIKELACIVDIKVATKDTITLCDSSVPWFDGEKHTLSSLDIW